jgi:CRISPR-associated protein Cas2
MWVVAIFDFPKYCKSGRQNMLLFTKHLEKEGFNKIQKGMYVRYCSTAANARVHKNKIISSIIPRSTVCLLNIADKEFSEIYSHFGYSKAPKNWPKSLDTIQFF